MRSRGILFENQLLLPDLPYRLDEMHDPMRDDQRFARSGPGYNQKRSVTILDRFSLFGC